MNTESIANEELHAQVECLSDEAIPWALEPLPRPEDVDLLTLSEDELLIYACHLRAETRALRETLHEAVAALAHVVRQRDQAITQRRQRVTRVFGKLS